MSFIQNDVSGKAFSAGEFLAHDETVERVTKTIPQSLATTNADGTKYVKAGTIFPSNTASAIGILYEDVDVTSGAMAGSVVTKGTVYTDKLPTAPASAAKTALEGLGIKLIATAPTVTRPY